MPERIGGYRLIRRLGRPGGFGAVYEAEAPDGSHVAVKVLHAEVLEGTDRARFRREINALRRASHPNLVRYVNDGEAEEGGRRYHFVVMELLSGRSLRALLDERGALMPAEAMNIAREIARGLAALHDSGIVHRDLKPANVLVCDDGRVVLVDFGVSRFLDYSTVTRDGLFVGSLRYAAPEQLSGEAVPASDLHALGAVLFEMLTGRRAFNAQGDFAVIQQIREEMPDPVSAHADVPPTLERLVASLMEKEPFDRPGSAAVVVEALAPVAAIPRGIDRSPYPREHAPRLFVRVRHDVEAAVSASLAGAVPDALVVNIADSSPKPLTLARRAANYHGIGLGVDPQLMRMAFARWADVASLGNLPYAPTTLAPHLPDTLSSRASIDHLAREVIQAQVESGANMLFAAHFPIAASNDDWQRRNPSLLASSIAAAKAHGLPLWALAAVSPEVICSEERQSAYVSRLVQGDPSGWLLAVDTLGSRAPLSTLVWGLRLGVLLQERGAPVVVARATGIRRLVYALGLGAEIGLGRYDGFRISDLRDGGGPGQTPPYLEIPELLCSLPAAVAKAVLRSGVLPECPCRSCVEAGNVEMRVAHAGSHNATIAIRERDALAAVTVPERVRELREQLAGALAIERRLRAVGALERPLPHLRLWPKVLDAVEEIGMLGDERLRRRFSA
jgi:hypothetical protein